MAGVVRDFFAYSSKKAKIVIGGVVAAILVAIISFVMVLLWPKKVEDSHVDIMNFSEYTDAPEEYRINIQNLIWNAIDSNNALSGIVFMDAIVREGSYKEFINDSGVVTAKFIVDIESLRYSFAVTASWDKKSSGKGTSDIYVGCPHYLDVIYTETKCIAATPIEQVERYLPHYDYLDEDKLITVSLRKYDIFQEYSGEPYLAVSVPACGSSDVMDFAKVTTTQWLKSVFLDPNDYHIEVIDICG